VLGHEGVGVVEEGELTGRAVSIEPTISCGRCTQCVRGAPNLCVNQSFLGLPPEPGLLREVIYHPPHLLEALPAGVSGPAGTLLEPLAVAISTFDLLKLRVASSVAILGCGGIGLLCLLVAKALAAKPVLCTDPVPHRREAALALGADAAVAPEEAEGEFDYVVEASGEAPAHQDMLRLAAPGAKIGVVGTPHTDEIRLVGHEPRRRGLTFFMVRRSRLTLPRAADLATRLPLHRLVSHVFPLSRSQEAFHVASTYSDGCLKTVIEL
ncbi:MAG: alcohol dehydrogenase catalytic domain-containing protein, partial [Fimbriimonadia bacterium]